jgi:MFS family permease
MAWYREVHGQAWKNLAAAGLGWMLDGMDVMLYAFALTSIQQEFGLSSSAAGGLASLVLVSSAVGGAAAGALADRFGRARVLLWSILVYSLFTGATATARTVAELAVWRTLVGLGLGGEWSAGSVLVAESWPAKHRGKAIGFMQGGWAIGYILAALLAAVVLPRYGWRPLFAIGVAPALLTMWIRRNIPEPAIWKRGHAAEFRGIFEAGLWRRTLLATALTTVVLFAYWGLFTWIPAYLASPAARGGAGLGIVRSTAWIVPMQIGAFFGYTLFGVAADRFGRRPVFLVFMLAAAILAPAYGLWARHEIALLVLGPLVGFFGHGYFSVFGAMLAELFPTQVRATAQGLCYNSGRALSALAPLGIGWLAERRGLGPALASTSVFFLAGALIMLALPETKGRTLE